MSTFSGGIGEEEEDGGGWGGLVPTKAELEQERREQRIARRLEVAQRLADALERLLSSHKDFMWCASQTPPRVPDLGWSQEIEDEARAVAAEWKALQ